MIAFLETQPVIAMNFCSVSETKNNLSDLIDRALKGEGVVITRHGTPVIEFKPIPLAAKPITTSDLEWLATCCLSLKTSSSIEAGLLMSAIRDEGAH